MDDGAKSNGSWWRTLPGVLTAAAATITALAGLLVALHQSGLIGGGAQQSPPPSTVQARPDPAAPSSPPPASAAKEQGGAQP
ncbi:MAG TPA: hypothetical protein VEL75_19885, partial [Candidatus Methylomirabilis sp.]|nr:hypothetical protein [Candidatus Methylomirabilis sp.]